MVLWSSSRRIRLASTFLATLLATLAALPLLADAGSSMTARVTKLAEGVYAIEHKNAPDHFPQGNTVVVVGANAVLVVDSCYLPSTAREDIAQIRRWTEKPVRYLVNTHWHGDHNQGNAAYASAFPGLAVVAHAETAKLMAIRVPFTISDYPHRMERFQHQIDTGKYPDGTALTEAEVSDLKTAVSGGKAASDIVSAEFRDLKVLLPNVTFDHELGIDLGGRVVRLEYLGRGNTLGDAIAYLPAEKILVAGDLVDSPVPYLGGGFPTEQAVTLKAMAALDFDTLVPGHGGVLQGKAFLRQETELIDAVVAAMNRAMSHSVYPQKSFGEMKQEVEHEVDVKAWTRKFAGDDANEADFFESYAWPGLLEAAFAEMWPR
jgi:glyoxylase-like metal-dependent hydrolase (beta-lactamase superfamily II)